MKILTALIIAGFMSSAAYASDSQEKADSNLGTTKVESVSTDIKAPLPKGEVITSEVEVLGAGGGGHCGSCWAFGD